MTFQTRCLKGKKVWIQNAWNIQETVSKGWEVSESPMLSTSGYDRALFAASVVDSAGLGCVCGGDAKLIWMPWLSLEALADRTPTFPCSGVEVESLGASGVTNDCPSWSWATRCLDFGSSIHCISQTGLKIEMKSKRWETDEI
jgi:hypothetical protein